MQPIISIVSGTYNRLKYLQDMVVSVRKSIGIGIPYEIILVDGGSTDGTIKWCKEQHDVKLIEQHILLGAVKAFNAGAYAATGKYVVLSNDDITFLDETLLCAISFMQDNPDVGIGCFYQDRRGWDWHIEQMPGIVDGKQTSVFYGQVCIVQKWLGDKVGWWGNYLHTYGGDNELSANILEMGYKILPVPCSKVHDMTPMDELRNKNNQVKKIDGQHPDTYAWLKKWTRPDGRGPIVRKVPIYMHPMGAIARFFYMPIYEPGHLIQKVTKRGLRDALAKKGLVVEYDYISGDHGLLVDTACAFDPHYFITQFQSGETKYHALVDELKTAHPKAKFINWNGDYHPEILYSEAYIQLMKRFDLCGFVTTAIKDVYDKQKINNFYWQIGWELVSDNLSMNGVPKHDVLFLGNGYSKDRLEMIQKVKSFGGINVGLYGNWPEGFRANGNTLYDFTSGAKLYKNCKVAIGDSQWIAATGFVSNRLFQAMSAGAFLLHQYFEGMDTLLGLRDGKHLVIWNTFDDLCNKISYYLSHEAERKFIADTGCKFVKKHHSFDARVAELMERLNV